MAYRSFNGTSWTQVGSTTTISKSSTAYIGLAVASGSTTSAATTSISNVSTTGPVTLFANSVRDESASDLDIFVNESAAKPNLEVYPNPGTDRINVKLQLEKPGLTPKCKTMSASSVQSAFGKFAQFASGK
ncbi:MAG: hypothetical protein ACKVU2_02655 [Saprospiraceae bacterium]